MKKLSFIILIMIFGQGAAFSQSCLPQGIEFNTQDQIDNFQTNYPGCTDIGGSVTITGNGITNLIGLNALKHIGGFLYVGGYEMGNNFNLLSLKGLHNIESIGGSLYLISNSQLEDFEGLNSLISIGNWFSVVNNWSLESFQGLDTLSSVGGRLNVSECDFINLEGLENLTTIGGGLNISRVYDLISLTGVENLTSIGGELIIEHTHDLHSLSGLDNIDAASISNLTIVNNASLNACEIQSICEYLVSPNGSVTIHSNAEGCNSPPEIAIACGNSMQCLPHGNYIFSKQADIDSFQVDYPACVQLEGYVLIHGLEDITDLNGLDCIESIAGKLSIEFNLSLPDIIGLENLSSVGGDLKINNNYVLPSLAGLDVMNSIGGDLIIQSNDELDNISALNNLQPSSIEDLKIRSNHALSSCNILSICEYLVAPNGSVDIDGNLTGCNSRQEVEIACGITSTEESIYIQAIQLFPNPANHELNISAEVYAIDEVSIYTLTGQQVHHTRLVDGTIDISYLQPGMYIVEVTIDNMKIRQKLLVQ